MKFIKAPRDGWLNPRFIRRIYTISSLEAGRKRYHWFALSDENEPHELHRNAAIPGAEDESLRIIPATVPMTMLVIWWDRTPTISRSGGIRSSRGGYMVLINQW
jgi:hypothetical protein